MGYHLGIDAGTTYTAAAVHRDGRVEIVPLGDRAASIPSVIFLKDDGSVLTGDAAYRRGLAEPERVAFQFKRRVGDAVSILLGGTPYSAEALMAKLIRWTVDKVSELEGGPPDTVALTHPANWGEYKLDRLNQAIRMADLAGAVTLTEPEAAAIHYASNERVEPGSTIAVYDLGGGTFDVAILRKDSAGWHILGSPEGIEQLGGVDVDEAVYDHVRRTLPDGFESLDPSDPATRAAITRLRRECVEAKEALSSDTDVTIAVLLPGTQTQVRLTRSELESMIGPTLEDTVGAMERALRSANVVPRDVTAVLLVGGSSRIPMVAELVSSAFGQPIAVDTHPKHAIALGAALAATADNLPAGLAAAEVPAGPSSETAEAPIAVVHTEETSEDPLPEPLYELPEPAVETPPPPEPTPEPEPTPVPTPQPEVTSPTPPEPEPEPEPDQREPEPTAVPLRSDGDDGDGDGRNPLLLLIGGLVSLLIVAIIGGILALGGGDDNDGDETGGTSETPSGATPTADVRLLAGRTFPTSDFPDGIAIGPDGNIWVAITGDDQVLRIDARTGETQAVPFSFPPDRVPEAGPDPLALTVTDDGFIWVSFRNLGFILRVDPNTITASGQVPIGSRANALVQAGSSLLVSTGEGVDVVDMNSMEVTASIPIGNPAGMAVDGTNVWVVNRAGGEVVEVDLSTNELTGRTFAVGAEPDGVALDHLGDLWVTNRGDGTLSWVDPDSGETEVIDVGTSPADIVADVRCVQFNEEECEVETSRIWFTDNGEGTLVLVDPEHREVVDTFDVGPKPLDLAIRSDAVVVTVTGDDTVQWVWAIEPPIAFASISDVVVESGRYVVTYGPLNYEPDLDGKLRTHFFWNTTAPVQAGVGDDQDEWLEWDMPLKVNDSFFDVANRPDAATAICAVVADSADRVADVTDDGVPNYNSGNCFKLPE